MAALRCRCGGKPHCPWDLGRASLVSLAHMAYTFACYGFGFTALERCHTLFPPPPAKPYDEVLRERALAYQPPPERSRLEAEERAALHEFTVARGEPEKAAAHRRWQDAAGKLAALKAGPQRGRQLQGPPSVEP